MSNEFNRDKTKFKHRDLLVLFHIFSLSFFFSVSFLPFSFNKMFNVLLAFYFIAMNNLSTSDDLIQLQKW